MESAQNRLNLSRFNKTPMISKNLAITAILGLLRDFHQRGELLVSSSQLQAHLNTSLPTLKRYLEYLVKEGQLKRTGKGRATRYGLTANVGEEINSYATTSTGMLYPKSPSSLSLLAALGHPLAARVPVTYQRGFVDQYIPNETFLLPRDVASSLAEAGRLNGQQPAGTYARRVLEPLLIDLSWSSSRLEGNRYTRLATEELFKEVVRPDLKAGDSDATMLLNHKRAIEFMIDAVPEYGLSNAVICNLHALLMQELLPDSQALGAIRNKIVNISDTTYVPTQVPSLLEEMLGLVVERARQVKNPVEAAFFLWVNLAYLQPFEDGNKRTSRLAANIPLLLYNSAPLSFMDVNPNDYAQAMMGVYEFLDVSLAVDLFAWTYKRSIQKYAVILESMGAPDPFRLRYREQLSHAIQQVLIGPMKVDLVLQEMSLPPEDVERFKSMLMSELSSLNANNCARYRLGMRSVEDWIRRGKPV